MKKLVAVPCFNEEDNIDSCIESLLSLKNEKIDVFDILVVNDGSKDDTNKKLSQFGNLITVISSKQNFGLSEVFNSILYFSREENYDQLIIFDSDNQYPFEDIPKLFEKITSEELDIVIGSRDFKALDHFSNSKKFFQRLGAFLVGLSLRMNLNDVTSGFRAYSSKALDSLFVTNTFTYTLETLYQAKRSKLKISDIETSYTNQTRDSRLFDSNFEYISKSVKIIFKSLLIYRSKLTVSILTLILSTPGLILTSRFFIKYFQEGSNPGNVQSLIVGVGYFNILFISVVLFSIVINNYKNKNFLLTNLYKPKHY